MSAVPAEIAIAAFERASGLSVVLHAPENHLAGQLARERFMHLQPVCVLAKGLRMARCRTFDGERTFQAIGDGRVAIKLCHAGLVEWTTRVGRDGRWRLFAGQRRAGPGLAPDIAQRVEVGPWRAQLERLKPVDADEARWLAELLAQLAARLDDLLHVVGPPAAPGSRTALIRRLVHEYHVRTFTLGELARHLGVSPARAGHAVREACGSSFLALLTEERLATAARLLRDSALPVEEVARSAGFADASRFHRCFRQRHGVTPAAFRRAPTD